MTDQGLGEFVSEILLTPKPELADARAAFLRSYGPGAKGNRFTKVKMDVKADAVLRGYFAAHMDSIESWFNVITPKDRSLRRLRNELKKLNGKEWTKILEK